MDKLMNVKSKRLVAINVNKIQRRVLKNGHIKKEWGVEITIDGHTVPICFGSKEATMIYIGALLKQMVGEQLYREDFLKPLSLGLASTKWLEELYSTLFYGTGRSFRDWHEKMKQGYGLGVSLDGHGISQAKGRCNRFVKKHLMVLGLADGLCCINAHRDGYGKTYYEIDIPSDNITISDKLSHLLYYDNMYTRA